MPKTPTAPQPDPKRREARPSDAEIAHAPNEAAVGRDPRPPTPDQRDPQAAEARGRLA